MFKKKLMPYKWFNFFADNLNKKSQHIYSFCVGIEQNKFIFTLHFDCFSHLNKPQVP
jgi:hypothetical protein